MIATSLSALTALTMCVNAQKITVTPISVSTVTTNRGPHAIAVTNGYAYVLVDSETLLAYDVSDPSAPAPSGQDSTHGPDISDRIVCRGAYAYVAGGSNGGLSIFDIGTPSSPLFVGRYDGVSIHDIALQGAFAFCAASGYGFRTIDISDPSDPFVVGQCSLSGWVNGIALSGDYALVGCGGGGLATVDISTPTNPVLMNVVDPGDSDKIVVNGTVAYVGGWSAGIHCFDVSTPTNPVLLSTFPMGAVGSIAARGSMVFATCYSNGVQVVDFSTPTNPVAVAHVDTRDDFSGDIAVDGEYVYVCDGIGNPSSPNEGRIWVLQASVDSNTNGVADSWELTYFPDLLHVTSTSDGDNDGILDVDEYHCGTDPTNRLSRLAIESVNASPQRNAEVTWAAQRGKRYAVQSSASLVDTVEFADEAVRLPAAFPSTSWTDTNTTDRMFYRVRLDM